LTQVNSDLQDQIATTNSNLVGTVTVSVGTNAGSHLIKKGIGICTLQLSVIIPEGFTSWNDQKIATVSFLPQNGAMRNIVLFSTSTGNSIKGRININGSGDVYLYITDLIPSGGVTIQETITYIAK
jgi:hypothetical protein